MPISDIPILSMLRERMEWHQERQRVLAENVANADTSNYQAKDLAPPDFEREVSLTSVSLATTEPGHISGSSGAGSQFATESDVPLRGAAARQLGDPRRRNDEGCV